MYLKRLIKCLDQEDEIKLTINKNKLNQKLNQLLKIYILLSDVFNIVYALKFMCNEDDFDMVIYIHLCENNKFYVGTSGQGPDSHSRMVNRLKQHLTKTGGSNFTQKHKVVSCLAYFPTKKLFYHNEENLMTYLIEKVVGIGNVEGGDNLMFGRTLTFNEIADMLLDNYIYCERHLNNN